MVNHAKSDNIAILAISRDDAFIASLADALQKSRELLHARDMATAENLTIAHKIGVVVTDRGTTHDEIKAISSRLRPIVPQLVIVVAGDRRHANDLMDLITAGTRPDAGVHRIRYHPLRDNGRSGASRRSICQKEIIL